MKPNNKRDVLFSVSSNRIPGGYEAQVYIATKTGRISISAQARKEDVEEGVSGTRRMSPQSAAVKDAIGQAADIASTPFGQDMIKAPAQVAIQAVQAARELTERMRDGDHEARQALAGMARSSSKAVRKAVHAQRLFGER